MSRRGLIFFLLASTLVLFFWAAWVEPHRSGCHRWHSCPSDTGSYVCGDLGYCSQCPDNQYCLARQPRSGAERPPQPPPPAEVQDETYFGTLVIDGDTFELESGERVRLTGVDTPEMDDPRPAVRALAEEATAFTLRMVEGKRVRLEYDQEPYDRYGRILAYVYLEDGTFLNAEIIRQGYGFAYTKFPFKKLEEFRKLEQEAREPGGGCGEVGSSSAAVRNHLLDTISSCLGEILKRPVLIAALCQRAKFEGGLKLELAHILQEQVQAQC